MIMNEDGFPYEEIMDLMKSSYNNTGIILFDLIDNVVDYLILVNVKNDKEFKLLLKEGYYK